MLWIGDANTGPSSLIPGCGRVQEFLFAAGIIVTTLHTPTLVDAVNHRYQTERFHALSGT